MLSIYEFPAMVKGEPMQTVVSGETLASARNLAIRQIRGEFARRGDKQPPHTEIDLGSPLIRPPSWPRSI